MRTFKHYLEEQVRVGIVRQFAAKAHEDFRQGLPANEKNEPRPRSKNGGPVRDINVPFDKLHPTAQQENIAAGHAALAAVKKHPHPNDIEDAADYIHKKWMERNPKDDFNAAQHVPYKDLPEDEKEKDRKHVRAMLSLKNK